MNIETFSARCIFSYSVHFSSQHKINWRVSGDFCLILFLIIQAANGSAVITEYFLSRKRFGFYYQSTRIYTKNKCFDFNEHCFVSFSNLSNWLNSFTKKSSFLLVKNNLQVAARLLSTKLSILKVGKGKVWCEPCSSSGLSLSRFFVAWSD